MPIPRWWEFRSKEEDDARAQTVKSAGLLPRAPTGQGTPSPTPGVGVPRPKDLVLPMISKGSAPAPVVNNEDWISPYANTPAQYGMEPVMEQAQPGIDLTQIADQSAYSNAVGREMAAQGQPYQRPSGALSTALGWLGQESPAWTQSLDWSLGGILARGAGAYAEQYGINPEGAVAAGNKVNEWMRAVQNAFMEGKAAFGGSVSDLGAAGLLPVGDTRFAPGALAPAPIVDKDQAAQELARQNARIQEMQTQGATYPQAAYQLGLEAESKKPPVIQMADQMIWDPFNIIEMLTPVGAVHKASQVAQLIDMGTALYSSTPDEAASMLAMMGIMHGAQYAPLLLNKMARSAGQFGFAAAGKPVAPELVRDPPPEISRQVADQYSIMNRIRTTAANQYETASNIDPAGFNAWQDALQRTTIPGQTPEQLKAQGAQVEALFAAMKPEAQEAVNTGGRIMDTLRPFQAKADQLLAPFKGPTAATRAGTWARTAAADVGQAAHSVVNAIPEGVTNSPLIQGQSGLLTLPGGGKQTEAYMLPSDIRPLSAGEAQQTFGQGVTQGFRKGSQVFKGAVLTPETVPQVLYHVTPRGPQVESTGFLTPRIDGEPMQQALGGSQYNPGVSFTTSLEDAQLLAREMRRSVDMANGGDMQTLLPQWAKEDEATMGLQPGALDEAVKYALLEGQGWPNPLHGASRQLREYRSIRSDFGGPKNPLFLTGAEAFVGVKPEDVQIITVPGKNLFKSGAVVSQGTDDFLSEVRAHGDVPLGEQGAAPAGGIGSRLRQLATDETGAVRLPGGKPQSDNPLKAIPGKDIQGFAYTHVQYADNIPGYQAALSSLREVDPDFTPTIVKWKRVNDGVVRPMSLIESPGFDRELEPRLGRVANVSPDGNVVIRKASKNPAIYHMKQQMVGPDYKGFDVAKATERTAGIQRFYDERVLDPNRVGNQAFWEREAHPELAKAGLETPAYDELTPNPRPMTEEEIKAANRTGRARGSVGPKAVVPKYVQSVLRPGEKVLDFGSGPEAAHAERLRSLGHDVTAYDFGNNATGKTDPSALSRQYDTVYGSNVLNTSANIDTIDHTLNQMVDAVKDGGRLIVNFPPNPNDTGVTPVQFQRLLLNKFDRVKLVGGSKMDDPTFEAIGPKRRAASVEQGAVGAASPIVRDTGEVPTTPIQEVPDSVAPAAPAAAEAQAKEVVPPTWSGTNPAPAVPDYPMPVKTPPPPPAPVGGSPAVRITGVDSFVNQFLAKAPDISPAQMDGMKALIQVHALSQGVTPDRWVTARIDAVVDSQHDMQQIFMDMIGAPHPTLEASQAIKTRGRGGPRKTVEEFRLELPESAGITQEHAVSNYVKEKFGTGEMVEEFNKINQHINDLKKGSLAPGQKTAFQENKKVLISIDLDSNCPFRKGGRPCLYCYVEQPRSQVALGEEGAQKKNIVSAYSYDGQIRTMDKETIDFFNNQLGGMRVFSFSDFTPEIQGMMDEIVADAQDVGLRLRVITKQKSMLDRYVNKDNIYFNVSTDMEHFWVPGVSDQGMDERLARLMNTMYNEAKPMISNAMSIDEATAYYNRYPEKVRIRYVATSLDDANRALADKRIHIITMYHGSSNNVGTKAADAIATIKEVQKGAVGGQGAFTESYAKRKEGRSTFKDPIKKPIAVPARIGNYRELQTALEGWFAEAPPMARAIFDKKWNVTGWVDEKVRLNSTPGEGLKSEPGAEIRWVIDGRRDKAAFGESFVKYLQDENPELLAKLGGAKEADKIGRIVWEEKAKSSRLTALTGYAMRAEAIDDTVGIENLHRVLSQWEDMDTKTPIFRNWDDGEDAQRKACCLTTRCASCMNKCGWGPGALYEQGVALAHSLKSIQRGEGTTELITYNSGRSIMRVLKADGIRNATTQIAYLFRRDLDTEMLKIAEKEYGIGADGFWKQEHEDRFARDFETYLATKKAPHPTLIGVFERFKEWLSGLFKGLGVAARKELSPDMRKVMDSLFATDEASSQPGLTKWPEKGIAARVNGDKVEVGYLVRHRGVEKIRPLMTVSRTEWDAIGQRTDAGGRPLSPEAIVKARENLITSSREYEAPARVRVTPEGQMAADIESSNKAGKVTAYFGREVSTSNLRGIVQRALAEGGAPQGAPGTERLPVQGNLFSDQTGASNPVAAASGLGGRLRDFMSDQRGQISIGSNTPSNTPPPSYPGDPDRLLKATKKTEIPFNEKVKKAKDTLVRSVYDKVYDFKKLETATGVDAYSKARLVPGSVAAGEDIIQRYVDPVIKSVGDDAQYLEAYMLYRREKRLREINPKAQLALGGKDPELDWQSTVRKYGLTPQRIAGVEKAAKELWALNDKHVIQPLLDAGMISQKMADDIRKKWPEYLPFYREGWDLSAALSGKGSKVASAGELPVDLMDNMGSERKIPDALARFEAMFVSTQVKIARNKAATALIEALDAFDPASVKRGVAPIDDSEGLVGWRVNGEEKSAAIPRVYADIANGLDVPRAELSTKFIRVMGDGLRMGAVSLNPAFVLVNPIRDAWSAWFREGLNPFSKQYVRGWVAAITRNADYAEAAKAGVLSSGLVERSQQSGDIVKRIKRGPYGLKINNIGDALLSPFRVILKMNEVGEQATRVATYHMLRGQGVSEIEAALRSRDVTVDFSKIGSQMNGANALIPFLNAGIQGSANTLRMFKKGSWKQALVRSIPLGIGVIGLYMYNKSNPDFDMVPAYERVNNFVIMLPARKTRADGTPVPVYIKVPKGPMVAFLSAPIEMAIEMAYKQKDYEVADQFLGALQRMGESIMPVNISPESLTTPVASTVQQMQSNWDTYRGKPIVPPQERNLAPKEQYGPETSPAAVGLGQMMNWSPRQIEFFLNDTFAGGGQTALWLASLALGSVGFKVTVKPGDEGKPLITVEKLSATPVVSRFVGTKVSEAARRNALQDRYAKEVIHQDTDTRATGWDDLDKYEQMQVIEKHPEVQKAVEASRGVAVQKNDMVASFWSEVDNIRKPHLDAIDAVQAQFDAGKISGNEYRTKIGAEQAEMAKIPANLHNESQWTNVPMTSEERAKYYKDFKIKAIVNKPVDNFIEAWYKAAEDAKVEGETDLDKMNQIRNQLTDSTPAPIVERAMAYLNRNKSPEYAQAQKLMNEYQRMPKYMGLSDEQAKMVSEVTGKVSAITSARRVPFVVAIGMAVQGGVITPEEAGILRIARKLYNPARQQYWSSHPLLTKYYSDLTPAEMEQLGMLP
jgi:hypothetical protein